MAPAGWETLVATDCVVVARYCSMFGPETVAPASLLASCRETYQGVFGRYVALS